MDTAFTDDQLALRAGLAELLEDRATTAHVRAALASATGADMELYGLLTGFGIADLPGPVEVGIAMEECGHAIVPAPVVSTVGICAPALAGVAPDDPLLAALRDGSAVPVLATDGEGTIEAGRVRGLLPLVPEAHVATHVVFAASEGGERRLVAVDAGAAAIEVVPTMDATRRLAHVTLDGAALDGAAARVLGPAGPALDAARLHGSVALACELVGIAQATLEMAVAYAKLREQFGKPIGTYQAVSHRCADMFVATETARSHAYYAAWALGAGSGDAPLAASQAKAAASDAAVFCAQSAIQVHGGIGFTWEHDAHLYLKRARSSAALLGTASEHRRRIADLLGV